MRDAGFSAFKGEHLAPAAALGKFVAAVETGRVPRGSLLIVEHLNRLTRQDVRKALRLFLTILDAGIDILTWFDRKMYREHSEQIEADLIIAIIYMSEAHKASDAKRTYSIKLWIQKRAEAAKTGQPLTRTRPAWLDWVDGRFVVNQERAAIVLRIFREVAAGDGTWTVAKRLNDERIPPMNGGRMLRDDQGNAIRPISNEWNKSRINQIVHADAVLGWMQPHVRITGGKDYHRKPEGGPIKCYPAVPGMTQVLVNQARAQIASRRAKLMGQNGEATLRPLGGGRRGEVWSNLFTGIAKCAECGGSMFLSHRNVSQKKAGWLRCTTAVRNKRGCSNNTSIPYASLEKDIIESVGGFALEASGLDAGPAAQDKLAELIASRTAEIEKLQRSIDNAMELFSEGPSKAVADRIAQWEARVEDLTTEADDAKRRQAIDVARPSVREIAVKMLNDLHTPGAENSREIRVRLASGLRQMLQVVWCCQDRDVVVRMISGNTIVIIAHCLKDGIYHTWHLDYGPYNAGDEPRKGVASLPTEMKLATARYRRIMLTTEENERWLAEHQRAAAMPAE